MNPSTDFAPKTITFRGATLALPDHVADVVGEWPADWEARMRRGDFAETASATLEAAGVTPGTLQPGLKVREAAEVVIDTLRAYGMDLGESSASSSSSPTTGTRSRPTSSRLTRSTSPRRGTSAPSRRGASGS